MCARDYTEGPSTKKKDAPQHPVLRATARYMSIIIACAIVLALGVGAFVVLPTFKVEPTQAEPEEQAVFVDARRVTPEDVQVIITGYGSVRPRDVVSIAPEVSGRVVEVHPRLEVGEIIPKGETLFAIDSRTYEARAATAEASVEQLKNTVRLLKTQFDNDRARLKTLQRTSDLAKAEHERLKTLFEQDEVGTRSGVEQAEQAYNAARDAMDQMTKLLETYPLQIKEAESRLAAAQAQHDESALNVERTVVKAPFDARIKSQSIREGQYVSPGGPVLTLADDSLLEISVPLNSAEARHWLRFNGTPSSGGKAWFSGLEKVDCEVRWTEDQSQSWVARLDRVERFDADSRTLYVAVQVAGGNALSVDAQSLPLVEGMFCQADIPGKILKSVYRVPRPAVSFEGTVYVAGDEPVLAPTVTLGPKQVDDWPMFEGSWPKENFSDLDPVACRVDVPNNGGIYYLAWLDRVVDYDEAARSLTLSLRMGPAHGESTTGNGPELKEGMACTVLVPSSTLNSNKGREYEGVLHSAAERRLKTVPVDMAYERGGEAFIASGLDSGDLVITTRLVNPLENTLLDVSEESLGRDMAAEAAQPTVENAS